MTVKIGIMAIGNELTSGRVQDTNSSFISQMFQAQGWKVPAMIAVGDHEDDIRSGLEFLLPMCDAVTVTGGLGPTADDITTEMIARIFHLPLRLDEGCLEHIKKRFEQLRLEYTENNAKQALFPEGAQTIFNPIGTAWGFALNVGGKLIAVMPGVPVEARKMLPEKIIPLLREHFGISETVKSRTIKLFGLPEAKIDHMLAGSPLDMPGLSIGFYPRFPEIHIVLTARGISEAQVDLALAKAVSLVEDKLGKNIFGYDNETLEGNVAKLLTSKCLVLAVAESLSGGLITDRLTNIPGSSAFLNRGIVAYSNECKVDTLGVPPEVLVKHGAVSEETAVLMAGGVRKQGNADVGISTTGIAGPTGGSDLKPVGTVFIAIADSRGSFCRHFFFRWRDRRWIKELTAQWALEMLRKRLVENGT